MHQKPLHELDEHCASSSQLNTHSVSSTPSRELHNHRRTSLPVIVRDQQLYTRLTTVALSRQPQARKHCVSLTIFARTFHELCKLNTVARARHPSHEFANHLESLSPFAQARTSLYMLNTIAQARQPTIARDSHHTSSTTIHELDNHPRAQQPSTNSTVTERLYLKAIMSDQQP